MPLINVHMASGRTAEQRSAMMRGITDTVVATLGVPVDTVRVWITEVETDRWMTGGELLADKRARDRAQQPADREGDA